MSYKNAFNENHVDFQIADIAYEDDAEGNRPDPIEFRYTAPNITVDSAGRFATHKIIGGTTVRQKIGEDPIEVEIEGVCTETVARQLDGLRDAEFGTIFSERLVGGSLDVHFASSNTSPLEDGGAVAMSDSSGEFLYSFTLSTVEVNVKPDRTETGGGGGSAGVVDPGEEDLSVE
jgi:hypothetical protein